MLKTTLFAAAAALVFAGVAEAQPALRIETTQDARVRLSWPDSAGDYGLEQASSIGSGAVWRAVTVAPSRAGGLLGVTVGAGDRSQFFRLRQGVAAQGLTRVVSTSPGEGEGGVSVTRETILRLDGPLAEGAMVTAGRLSAEFGGRRLLTRAEVSRDRRTLTLFYLENMPASARVVVTLDGTGLEDASGRALDVDGDGQAGGRYVLAFETAGISGLPGTGVEGRVWASEKNPDGSNRPLANVTITVDGAEETLRTRTDATGAFRLMPAPAGRFFVHVDGRTAVGSEWPGGAYYPFVGKAWEAVAGKTNNLAGGTGEIFLPRIQDGALTVVSSTEETRIAFSADVVQANPALAGVEIQVPPNALFNENGTRGGRVGIAPVPSDRLPEPLPPGLNLPIVITIQTDGPQNFDQPVPVRFPNLPDPVTGVRLPAGAKTVLWSFNHDTGRWEAQGTATISADGNFALTDPGVGVLQPGWHGVAPGVPVVAPPRPPLPSECSGDDCPECVQTIFCNVPTTPGRHYALCGFDCLGDVVDELFGDGEKPERTAFETGLRCIGGPDSCPQNPNDSLTPERRDCMDRCQFPQYAQRVFVLPCEGFSDPCERPFALHGRDGGDMALAATANLLPDRFEEQRRFWDVEGEFLMRLTGTPKIVENALADIPKINAFFAAFAERVRVASASGIHLSAQERSELLAMERPAQFTLADWTAMVDRLDSIQGAMPAEVVAADQALSNLVAELKRRGWKYRLDGVVHGYLRLSRARAPQLGSAAFPARAHYYRLKHHQSGFVQRGRLNAAGHFDGLVLSPGGYYTILYFDAVSGGAGAALFQAPEVGGTAVVPTAPIEPLPEDVSDLDGDGLPDFVEDILGTSPGQRDTDGDGVSDGDEMREGTNPLDGVPQVPGPVAGLDTEGTALDVLVLNDVAAVADSTAGVALMEVSNPLNPVRLAQWDTPGRAVGVAGVGTLLAVADDSEGITLLDLSVPWSPSLVAQRRFSREVRAVAVLNGYVVAGLASGALALMDEAGGLIAETTGDGVAIQDLLARNGVLYALKQGSVETFAVNGGALVSAGKTASTGSAGAGGRRLRLSGGGNRLFATHATGYNVFDISVPSTPAPLRQVTTRQFGWKQIVPNGGFIALAAVDANSTDDGAHDVSVYGVGGDGTGTNFVGTLATPGLAAALTFHRGMALVADGAAGLTVLNYQARDTGVNPPSVQVRARFGQNVPGAESGARFTLVADASDDQGVRNVEFYVNDQRVAVVGGHPYEVVLRAPELAPGTTAFTVRARAFDTGGNFAWSDVLTLDLSKDLTAPAVIGFRPGPTERWLVGTEVPVSVRFDEPMLESTVGAAFQLVSFGADGVEGTADDALVASTLVPVRPGEHALQLGALLPMGAYEARVGTNATDLAGNPLGNAFRWPFQVQPLHAFVGTTDRLWNASEATANNWSTARLPTQADFVRIALPEGLGVTASQSVAAHELYTASPVTFAAGTTLTLGRQAVFDDALTVTGGRWQGGVVRFRGETQVSGTLDLVGVAWTNEGQLTQGASGSIAVRNPAGLRTEIRNGPTGIWDMVNSQVWVQSAPSGPVDFVNEGLLVARGGERIFIGTTRFLNLGTVEVREGTLLEMRAGDANGNLSQHLGTYRVDRGATLDFTGRGEFGRASRMLGEGTVNLSRSVFAGSYEVDGTNNVGVDMVFSGPVRSRGIWNVGAGNGTVTFTGLSPEITGRVDVLGGMTVAAQSVMTVSEMRVYRDLTVSTALEVNGPLRFDSIQMPTGGMGAARLLGAGRLRANGPLTFAGIVNSGGTGVVEVAGTAKGEGRAIVQFNNNGFALAVLPSGILDVSNMERVTPRGGITNDGVILKNGAGTTELTRNLINRGTVEVGGGTLRVVNGRLLQTAGAIRLAGGALTVQASGGTAADTTVSLQGGVLEGSGALTCRAVTNMARIAPGLPLGVLRLEVGNHPTLSNYRQVASGTLSLDIHGMDPGTGHDQLQVSGRALLDGTLELQAGAGFDPAVAQEWVILTCLQRVGTFRTVTGADLPGGKRFDVVYEDTQVKLRVVGP